MRNLCCTQPAPSPLSSQSPCFPETPLLSIYFGGLGLSGSITSDWDALENMWCAWPPVWDVQLLLLAAAAAEAGACVPLRYLEMAGVDLSGGDGAGGPHVTSARLSSL